MSRSIFIPMIPKGKPINYFNTWEAADALRQELLSEDDPENESPLERAWVSAMDFSWEKQVFLDETMEEMDWLKFRNRYRNKYSPAEALGHWVSRDSIPPPELLYCVSQCISVYMFSALAQEVVTLEEVFFGPPKKGKGNHAQSTVSSMSNPPYEEFHSYLQEIKDKDGLCNIPQEDLAEIFFDEREKKYKKWMDEIPADAPDCIQPKPGDRATREPPEIDTFLRGYRRWKEKKQD